MAVASEAEPLYRRSVQGYDVGIGVLAAMCTDELFQLSFPCVTWRLFACAQLRLMGCALVQR